MIPDKILYVDDEAMALKYFDRLVSPLAPVITAASVAEGKAVLAQRGAEIAVLVSDQRMPGARGNELLSYAREHHPVIVRMLTTAYSELGEAIDAINAGEIYRYIVKPWDLESLQADLRNALELAVLRGERDSLLREKMLLQQQQLLGHRAGQLVLACEGFVGQGSAHAVHVFLQTALMAGCPAPAIDWGWLDYADLIEAEAERGLVIGRQLARWHQQFSSAPTPAQALAALAQALDGQAQFQDGEVRVTHSGALIDLLAAPAPQAPAPEQVAWLAWLMHWSRGAQIRAHGSSWGVSLPASSPQAEDSVAGWLAGDIERLIAGMSQRGNS
ncbi:MAG: response regulator [Ramlibacter sp.]|nr:response regulator [Ramlibacter sp.]